MNRLLFLAISLCWSVSASAQTYYPPPTDVELTPFGAEVQGNADGTIPKWTGSISGVPTGLEYKQSGDPHPDPYAKEKPYLIISSSNYREFRDKLSPGLIALIEQYPKTFQIPVYTTHRDFRISDFLVDRTAWNAENTVLVNGSDGLQQYTGGVPFPYAKTGVEAIWNGRIVHFYPTLLGYLDDVAVFPGDKRQYRRLEYIAEFPYSNPDNLVGDAEKHIGINAGLVLNTVVIPERSKGQMVLVHEAVDQVNNERQAWAYVPSTRRVRRAPTVGFDTPDGPGGLVTVDDALGFNGALIKYDWKLLGKKEMYVPFHNYRFDDLDTNYATLLMEGHANPDYMRYELRRVWVVEANLKEGQRHIYQKRRFYLEEDSWQIVLLESYDGTGNLWRVGILNTIYDYLLEAYIDRAQIFHDLRRNAYIAQRLVNEIGHPNLMGEPRGEEFYSPNNLRKLGR